MGMQKINKNESVSNFIKETSQVTAIHRGIQRESVWTKKNRMDFKENLMNDWVTQPITIADLKSSLDRAIVEKNQIDIEFFSSLINEGYEYLSIDGNNRTQYLVSEYFELSKDYKNTSNEVRQILKKLLNICEVHSATKYDLHRIVLNANSNVGFNDAEKRNTIDGFISNYIRKISDKFETISSKIKGIKANMNRMLDDEMYAQFLYYFKHPVSNISKDNLLSMYKSGEKVVDYLTFEKLLKNWSTILSNIILLNKLVVETSKGTKKSNDFSEKSVAYNLFFFLCEVKRKYGLKLNEDVIMEFSKRYLELENERLIKHTDLETKVCYWMELNSCSTFKKIDTKFSMIYEDFGDEIYDYFYKLDPVRNFTKNDKVVKCVETKGKIIRTDGTIIDVTPSQVLDGGLVHAGHDDGPHIKGCETVYDKMSLQISTDNIIQSDNH
jgi:hypothetical protein